MRIRVFIIAILNLVLIFTQWCSPCQGKNLLYGDQAVLRNKIASFIEYADEYVSAGNTQNHFESNQILPELKETIQDQSIRQITKSWHYNSVMLYIYILLIVIGLGFMFFRIIDRKNKQLMTLNQNEIREQIVKELKIDHQLLRSEERRVGKE